ncbi:MAG: tRNA (adenosine(37)-N6)-dimethylallyltransferase MiaA [Dehalococcoidia bacterium]|jgi:tRNA dimethylallyltransferase|nr:tRNA (adenosine(37)-N6)-dimethylallyltransferase MiaA [Dehalococcoidia bacterium]|tara:strand:- start:3238 stop:4188 length:951 start_codon:yes stop_codon:yes gene_type:complete
MESNSRILPKLIAIVGPTGIGKTALSEQIIRYIDSEIVSIDSRQIYRNMDIGTAKPKPYLLNTIPHHLINIVDPIDDFSITDFLQSAKASIEDIISRGKTPLLVGGTGQYFWSLIENWTIPSVPPNPELRKKFEQIANEYGAEHLFEELKSIDVEATKIIDSRNIRRVIRALEVGITGNKKWSELRSKDPVLYDPFIIGLTKDRTILYRNVDSRIDQMLLEGWIEEVRLLKNNNLDLTYSSMSSLGYDEIYRYISGEVSINDATEKIKINTHRFIRSQYNWFRISDTRIHWFDTITSQCNYEQEIKGLIEPFILHN